MPRGVFEMSETPRGGRVLLLRELSGKSNVFLKIMECLPLCVCFKNELSAEVMTRHTVIVNTTPLGMHPKTDECPPLDYTLTGSRHLLFDVIYNPEKTLFMQHGEQNGATVCNGMEMLIGHAKAAWRIWNE